MLDAFLDRAKPDAICVERAPEAFARNDFYEFTYEVQGVVVPYARRNDVDLCPIDWTPSRDDELLGFGLDLETPPELRPRQGFQQFLTFPDAKKLERRLYDADDRANLSKVDQWATQAAPKAVNDLPRRLYLYRTYMQAKRVAQAAHARQGATLVVVVGEFHKHDIEAILADDNTIRIVQPSTLGVPHEAEVEQHNRREYRLAVANFNLLGEQASTGNLDIPWLRVLINQLSLEDDSAEVQLLATRLDLLEHRIDATEAIARYSRIAAGDSAHAFTWNGVQDRSRVDSYFDPFGNLNVRQRAWLESARESYRLGDTAAGDLLLPRISEGLSPRKAAQLHAYWQRELLIKRG
ncbi:hypothetical protein [Dyella sp. ASV21]|uniref:hypothetical protein n=1 Tax=Dyella sp. ASV21 TaxID=2795114 RepID=UPI0018EE0483|nr:hypothetical protein [Dyella sp. ASV21]